MKEYNDDYWAIKAAHASAPNSGNEGVQKELQTLRQRVQDRGLNLGGSRDRRGPQGATLMDKIKSLPRNGERVIETVGTNSKARVQGDLVSVRKEMAKRRHLGLRDTTPGSPKVHQDRSYARIQGDITKSIGALGKQESKRYTVESVGTGSRPFKKANQGSL